MMKEDSRLYKRVKPGDNYEERQKKRDRLDSLLSFDREKEGVERHDGGGETRSHDGGRESPV